MSRPNRDWPLWKLAVSAIPVGVGVAVFAAIRWPLDFLIVVGLLGYAALLSRFRPIGYWKAMAGTLTIFACIFLAQITLLALYALTMLPQHWLPWPAVAGLGLTTILLALAVIFRLPAFYVSLDQGRLGSGDDLEGQTRSKPT